jgi:hypothetical protein
MRLVVLVLLLLVRAARADVGVIVGGDPNMRTTVLSDVQHWVQDKNHVLVAAPLGDATTAMIDCFVMDDVACARKVFEKHSRASTVVFVRVDMLSGERSFQLNAYWFTKGKAPENEKRPCVQCDDTKLHATVDALMIAIVHKGSDGRGMIKIPGPSDMQVKIDGTELGTAPIEHEVPAGSHELVFLHAGDPVDVRRVQVDEGAVVEVGAPRLASSSGAGTPSHRSRALPAVMILGGIVAAAAGGTLMYYGSRDEADSSFAHENGTEVGLPLTIVGAFVVGAGTSLFVSRSGSRSSVGVAGSF